MSKKEEQSEQYRRKAYEVSLTRKRCQHNNEVIDWNNEIVEAFKSGWDACVEDLYKNKGFPVDLNGNVVSYEEAMENVEMFNKQMKKEFLDKACEWLENNLARETPIITDGYAHINFGSAIKKFRKAMEE